MSISLPIVSWEAKISDTVIHTTDYNYTCTVTPININDPGYGTLVVGYYIVDFIGHIFRIEEIISGYNIRVYDLIEDTQFTGPYSDKNSYVYASLQDAVLLAQAKLNRLDASAEDFVRSLGLDPKILEVDAIQFNTDYIPSIESEGLIWWNEDELALNIATGVGPVLQVGQEQYLLIYNDTGFDITNMTVLRPKAATIYEGNVVPTVEKAIASIHDGVEGTIMVSTMLIPNNSIGLATRFGRVRGGDTSGFTPGDGLFISEITAGELVNVRPEFPNYNISIGGALNSESSPDGEIFVSITRDVFNTFNDAWDGSIRETIKFYVESDGATITGSLENQAFPNSDLTLNFSDGFYTFDTTPAATVTLTAGSATIPQTNYVYIDKATKTLQISTSDWPVTIEHIKVAQVSVLTAAKTQLDGALRNQNWNDHLKTVNDNGHILHITEKLRQFEAQWNSGTEGSAVIGIGNEVWIKNTSGIVYQLHRQTFPIHDMTQYVIDSVNTTNKTFTISNDGDLTSIFPNSRYIKVNNSTGNDGLYTVASTIYSDPDFIITVNEIISSAVADGTIGDDMQVVNHFTTPYDAVLDLSDILLDASGNALNNTSFSIVVWGVTNKSGQPSHIMANLPTATYNKNFPDTAVSDADNYSVYSIPKDFQGVGFLISRFTFVNSGGIWSLYDTEDLRGKIPNTTAGGGAGGTGVTSFLGLNDTPSAYTSQAEKLIQVNTAETALEFISDVKLDSISEYTLDTGVTIDGTLIKDNKYYPLSTATGYFFDGDADDISVFSGGSRSFAFYSNNMQIFKNTYPSSASSLSLGLSTRSWLNTYTDTLYTDTIEELTIANGILLGNTLTVDQTNGRVGIGTITPNRTLDIQGILALQYNDSSERAYFYPTVSGLDMVITNGTGNVDFRLDTRLGIETIYYNGAGNFGIGTKLPLAKLHINGGVGSLSTGIAFGDGDTGFYEQSDDAFWLDVGGINTFRFYSSYTSSLFNLYPISSSTRLLGASTLSWLSTYTDTLYTDVINELNTDAGITAELVLLKDGRVYNSTDAAPTTDIELVNKKYVDDSISTTMVYPSAGIALSTGSAWGTSITNNSTNWNNAYTHSQTTTGNPHNVLASDVITLGTDGQIPFMNGTTDLQYESTGTFIWNGTTLDILSGSGNYNIFIGNTSGSSNTLGDWNTFLGTASGRLNESGDFNTFLGGGSGEDNVSGGWNTYIGIGAGGENISGSYNINLGRNSGQRELGSNKLYIDNQARGTTEVHGQEQSLIYGEFDIITANQFLRINGQLELPYLTSSSETYVLSYDDATGQVYYTAASGVGGTTYWSAATGGIHYSSGNVGIGTATIDSKLQVVGTDLLGYFIGTDAGLRIRNNVSNIISLQAVSGDGLAFNTNGLNERMRIDSTGNVGIGDTLPTYKLDVNGDGRFVNDVTADGFIKNSSSDSYVLLGGGGHTLLSSLATPWTEDANYVYYSGIKNVGIGTSAPGNRLTVAFDTTGDAFVFGNASSTGRGMLIHAGSGTGKALGIYDYSGTTESFRVAANGNTIVGGSTAAGYMLDVQGTSRFTGLLTASANISVTGTVTASSTMTATNFILSSDIRLKTNIESIKLSNIDDIEIKQFNYKNELDRIRYGVIAQDLEKIHPEMIYENSEGMKQVAYTDFLIAKIASLENRLKQLEAK